MKKSASNCTFFITLLIFSFSPLLFAAQNRTCYPQDQIALNKIHTALGLAPPPNCCDWDALLCSNVAPFRIITLRFYNDSTISGQIPPAIGDLSSLTSLHFFSVPNLTGNIPPDITKLTHLSELIIRKTSLSGPIPTFLANLKNLQLLDLSENALTGSIPPQLSQIPYLGLLDLRGNRLTGSIPESFGYFSSNLWYLYMSNCSLKGAIPKSLDNLNLKKLDLSQNRFTGDASFFFGKNKMTEELFLQRNKFRFDLSKVEFPSNLTGLNLGHNSIFGSLPQQLTQLNLDTVSSGNFDVSYNHLCGEIPQGGRLQSYGPDSYSHNKCLCGAPLPPCK